MKLDMVRDLLQATVVCNETLLDLEVKTACACDLMSDVLAFVKDQPMLLTGLNNAQAVRTAAMMDMRCVVFVRGKQPVEAMVELAEEMGIVLMTTKYPLFSACAILARKGLEGGGLDDE